MDRKRHRRFSREFKIEAVQLAGMTWDGTASPA
jgi:transposase-like protein